MSGMFGRDVKTVDKHVNNAFQEGLANLANLIVAKFATIAADGKTYQTEHFLSMHLYLLAIA